MKRKLYELEFIKTVEKGLRKVDIYEVKGAVKGVYMLVKNWHTESEYFIEKQGSKSVEERAMEIIREQEEQFKEKGKNKKW